MGLFPSDGTVRTGSRHMCDGVVDDVSLSEAGYAYLIELGIPPKADVIGNEVNIRYKGEDSVYNSSDECYVACRLFDELGYREMRCVCSPAQLLRKALSYVMFGYMPLICSIPLDDMFHSYVRH